MKNYFTPGFFKFLLGFAVILLLSFILIAFFSKEVAGMHAGLPV
jgi:hypothetical protein